MAKKKNTGGIKGILWEQRKQEGHAGMAGAGRATRIPSKKKYNRKDKHKGRDIAASYLVLKVAMNWLKNKIDS